MVRAVKFALLLILLLGAAAVLDHVHSEIGRGVVTVITARAFFFWLGKVFSDDEILSIV